MRNLLPLLMISIISVCFSYSPAWAKNKRHNNLRWYEFWKKHNDDEKYRNHFCDRRFSKVHRISSCEAKEIVSKTLPHWQVGEGWEKIQKGRIELIIPLLYQRKIIGDIKVNPVTGNIMSEKIKHSYKKLKISLAEARKTVQKSLPKMNVEGQICLGKHGSFWEVPLMFRGMRVEMIKVGTGSGSILSDWHKEEEAYYYRHGRSLKLRKNALE